MLDVQWWTIIYEISHLPVIGVGGRPGAGAGGLWTTPAMSEPPHHVASPPLPTLSRQLTGGQIPPHSNKERGFYSCRRKPLVKMITLTLSHICMLRQLSIVNRSATWSRRTCPTPHHHPPDHLLREWPAFGRLGTGRPDKAQHLHRGEFCKTV